MVAILRASILAVVVFACGGALAQPKPALVQNRDEPARAKYQETVSHPEECNSSSTCIFTFSAVPAGKRLVVTWANATYFISVSTAFSWAVLYPSDASGVELYLTPSPDAWAGGQRIINTPAQMYVEAGTSPTLQLVSGSLLSGGAKATLVGYYVSVP